MLCTVNWDGSFVEILVLANNPHNIEHMYMHSEHIFMGFVKILGEEEQWVYLQFFYSLRG